MMFNIGVALLIASIGGLLALIAWLVRADERRPDLYPVQSADPYPESLRR